MFSRRNIEREESRMSTGGSSLDLSEGRRTATGDLPSAVGERATELAGAAGRRVAEIRDVTAEKAAAAGSALRDVANEIELEQFLLRGNAAGHPFRVEMEDEAGGERYLAFEFNLRTDDGDTIRFTGRKRLSSIGGGHMTTRVESESEVDTGSETTTSRSGGI
jgi:hypothetical protein